MPAPTKMITLRCPRPGAGSIGLALDLCNSSRHWRQPGPPGERLKSRYQRQCLTGRALIEATRGSEPRGQQGVGAVAVGVAAGPTVPA